MRVFIGTALCFFVLSTTAWAAISTTGNVSPVNPGTWTLSTDGYVGNTSDGTLTVSGGSDILSGNAYIGDDSGSTGIATISGSGSTWTIDHRLEVGVEGDGTLNISNHGLVSNDRYGYDVDDGSYIGATSGAVGEVNVDGSSLWKVYNNMRVGYHGGTGTLNITNGSEVRTVQDDIIGSASVQYYSCFIGYCDDGNGTVLVSGGSTWNTGRTYAACSGGLGGNDTMGVITVNGNGSTWNCYKDMTIGYDGTGTLNITNGGEVNLYDTNHAYVGYDNGSTGNILVSGGSTLTTNANFNIMIGSNTGAEGVITVTGEGTIWDNNSTFSGSDDATYGIKVGREGVGELHIINGGDVTNDGSVTRVSNVYIGSANHGANLLEVDGANSTLTSDGDMYVGGYKHRNDPTKDTAGTGTMEITDGGSVSNADGRIGFRMADSEGTVTVDGNNSTWTNSGSLYVGDVGDGTLEITDGGAVTNTTGIIGSASGSTGTVTVGEVGATYLATWTNSGTLYVGDDGTGTLNIYDQGKVTASNLSIGTNGTVDLDGGTLELNGTNATTTISDWTSFDFSSGTIQVTNGADVVAGAATTLGSSQTLTVTGASSTWDNGIYGMTVNGGTLNIESNGAVATAGLSFGTSGTVNLDGGTLEVTDDMGYYDWYGVGTFNFVSGEYKISNGADVTSAYGIGLTDNQVLTVTENSTMSLGSNYLSVGGGTPVSPSSSDSAGMNITGGADVSSGDYIIGAASGRTGEVLVDGAGSTLTSTGYFYVGDQGTGTLTIQDDAQVNSSISSIGRRSDSSGTVNVDGGTWTSSGSLTVGGEYGAGYGELNITNDGSVSCSYAYIGDDTGSVGEVTVDGGGLWSVTGNLKVANQGTGTLNIEGGGEVNCGGVIIGQSGAGTVMVDGESEGSLLTVTTNLYVGAFGAGELYITDDGMVAVDGNLVIDYFNNDDCFVRMFEGGVLALLGNEDDSLEDFLSLVSGDADAIQWWNYDEWEPLNTATEGTHYSLEYQASGTWTGYTFLTVTADGPGGLMMMANVPEPSTVALLLTSLAAFGLAVLRKRNKR